MTVDQVIDTVAEYYQVSRDALMGSGRSRAISFPRQMVMFLSRTETEASLPQIGSKLGGRDHTTVLHGYDKISELVETDASVRQDMMSIKSKLYN